MRARPTSASQCSRTASGHSKTVCEMPRAIAGIRRTSSSWSDRIPTRSTGGSRRTRHGFRIAAPCAGPCGVLMDRQGNSLDRALLLATLLEKAGHTVRLAHGELARGQAVDLLPTLVARRVVVAAASFGEAPAQDLHAVAARYELDGAAIEGTQESMTAGVGRLFTELHARAADQTERLLRELKRPDPDEDWARRHRHAVDMLRDHWWVQWSDGTTWRDLDLLAPDSIARSALTTPVTTATLPSFRLSSITRSWYASWPSVGRGDPQRATRAGACAAPIRIARRADGPSGLAQSDAQQLQSDPDSPHGLRAAALEQDTWGASLAIGPTVVAHGTIALTSKRAVGGGAMGGLGAGILGAAREMRGESTEATDELSAVWIEYEVRVPGEEPHTIRRAVFDLFGPAARSTHSTGTLVMDEQKRLTRGLALMLRSEMLPVTSAVAPEYLAHLTGRNLVANRTALRSIAAGVSSLSSMEPDSILGEGTPPLSPLWSLALARLEWSRHGDVQYVDRIGLLTRHRHPGPMGDAITLRGSIDVVTGDFGVSLAASDAFVVRHTQGVFDTNAEALWWTGEGLNNTGEAFAESHEWVTLASPDGDIERLHLPPDARSRIAQDLASGLIVAAPTQPVPRGPDQFVGWWRIDPRQAPRRESQAMAGVSAEPSTPRSRASSCEPCGAGSGSTCFVRESTRRSTIFGGPEPSSRRRASGSVGRPDPVGEPRGRVLGQQQGLPDRRHSGRLRLDASVSHRPLQLLATRPWLMPRATWLDRLMRDQRGGVRIPPRLARGRLPGLARARSEVDRSYRRQWAGRGAAGHPVPGRSTPWGRRSLTWERRNLALRLPLRKPARRRLRRRRVSSTPAPKTGPPEPAPARPGGLPAPSDPQARLEAARAAHDAAGAEELTAISNELAYKASRPGGFFPENPSWNEAEYNRLQQLTNEKTAEAARTFRELREAQRAAPSIGRGRGLQNFVPEPRPAPGPCLPACGNENPTVPAGEVNAPAASPPGALEVGAAGIAGSSTGPSQ